MLAERCDASLVHCRGSVQLSTKAIRVALAGLSFVESSRSPASSLAIQNVYAPVIGGCT
jgi:hypothetical protein